MTVHIYGAGMAGLLSGNVLRRLRPVIHEQQASLPDNHGALLRFRSGAVEAATGQPFRRVCVVKAVKGDDGQLHTAVTLRDANRYSFKVSGEVRGRSVMDLSPCERYIAPSDFLAVMAQDLTIELGDCLTLERLRLHTQHGDSTISTVPMPALMDIVGWEDKPQFSWRPIWSIVVKLGISVDVYQTIYYPGGEPFYRASITGSDLIIESAHECVQHCVSASMHSVLNDFGIPVGGAEIVGVKRQEYGKLSPTDEGARQRFILQMTDQYRLYSVGRFATWRQVLLDDVVEDLRKVERWIVQRNDYCRRLEMLA